MTARIPLPILACLLLTTSLFAPVIISNDAAPANDVTPATVPASTPARAKAVLPTTTNSATPTRCSTPTPDVRLSPPEEVVLNKLPLELETRIEIAIPTPTLSRPTRPTPPPAIAWPPATVGKALVVDQEAQMLRVYENGVEIRALPASTGIPPLHTPAFLGHIGRYASTIYGYGELADNAWYVLTARGNIYIHGAPYTLSEGIKVYKEIESLGVRPSSHGCIRLYPADAEWLTAWDPQSAPILITPLDLSKEW
ncbi:MAG TPA: L,D-transpeptidase [Thermoflexia bacterium]|nr:L,D-transpeptidase [Thermoflexia bacterium]